jgi:hypothetical protein
MKYINDTFQEYLNTCFFKTRSIGEHFEPFDFLRVLFIFIALQRFRNPSQMEYFVLHTISKYNNVFDD